MSENQAALGRCPDCGRRIRPAYALIEYVRDDGTTAVFAECPECNDVVRLGADGP